MGILNSAAFDGAVGFKSDVFSFGVVLWEMLTKKSPHDFWLALLRKQSGTTPTSQDIIKAIMNGKRLPLPRVGVRMFVNSCPICVCRTHRNCLQSSFCRAGTESRRNARK